MRKESDNKNPSIGVQMLPILMVGLLFSLAASQASSAVCMDIDRYFDELTITQDSRPITHESANYSHYKWSVSGRRDDGRVCNPSWTTNPSQYMCDWTLIQVVVYYDQNILGFTMRRSKRESVELNGHEALKQITCEN